MKPFDIVSAERFFALVDTRPGLGPDGDCHFWLGPCTEAGAGHFTARLSGRTVNFKAHRLAHWFHYGVMPDELVCCRACGEPRCVNPRHMFLADRKKITGPARIMRLVDQTPGQGPHGDCWEYTGYREKKSGYGVFSDDRNKPTPAHRYMYELVNGEIPKQMMVLHTCDNGPCCRPDHLYLGDHAQNMRDRNERGRTARHRGNFKISEETARAIKDASGRHEDIASAFGVSRTTVSFIKSGKRWVNLR